MYERNQIVLDTKEQAQTVAEILLENNNIVMVSREEEFYVLNWIFSFDSQPHRSNVVFMALDEFEERFYEREEV